MMEVHSLEIEPETSVIQAPIEVKVRYTCEKEVEWEMVYIVDCTGAR